MTDARKERRFRKACRAVAHALVPAERKAELRASGDLQHLTSRFSTFHVLLCDEIGALMREPARSNALALILATDLAWQVVRALGGRSGDDVAWMDRLLPPDHAAIDADLCVDHFARQRQIVADARWVFDLHSALRHPIQACQELLPFLCEPISAGARDRLLSAARYSAGATLCAGRVGSDHPGRQ
jgi:hypothetical protein